MSNKLLMPFVDQSKEFAFGFECGRFYEMMNNGVSIEKHLFNSENEKQIELMCKRYHYQYTIEHIAEGWANLTAKLDPSKAN